MEGPSTPSGWTKEIVLIDKRPKKVIVERIKDLEIHYFYWDLDLYKPFDYEPVTVMGSYVLSRYHWKGLVLWNAPVKREGKPLVSFFFGVHTPLVISEKWVFSLIFCVKDISLEERFYLGFYLTVLNAMLQGLRIDEGRFHGYKDLIEEDSVPEKYRFNLKAWDFLIVVGELPRDLPELIKKRLEECE
ncbi:MAG: hypothetical protein J7L91_05405 [Candidatus Korarchaeota archaeon]|nr:hypothetical protein [Candidatus Korarchaeota archaeon]